MRIHTIAPIPSISFKAAAAVFMGTFGAVWLFVEPLGMFGLATAVGGRTGLVLYLLMLAIALLATLFFIRGYRWHKVHNLPFVILNIASASDGATYLIRASTNMQVGDFLHEFVNLLSKGPGRERVEVFRRRYIPVLQVLRGGKFVDVESNLTISAARLRNRDSCQVRGEEIPNFDRPLFSRASASVGSGKISED